MEESTLPGILLVEDSEDNRMLIGIYLKQFPCRLEIASNGREAVEKFSPETIDCILMDLQMPVLDGFEATRAIREAEATGQRVPIIALSAHTHREEIDRSLAAGCDEYLTKPIKKEELLECIRSVLPGEKLSTTPAT